MHVTRALQHRIQHRLSRCLTHGCEYNDSFRLNVPQHRNVVKVTVRHDKEGTVKVHQQVQAVYGQTSGFQPCYDEPNCGFATFRQKVSKYNALHAPIDNFTFANVRLPSEHRLFPHLVVVSLDISQHDINRIERYIKQILGSKMIYFYIQACDVPADTLRKNMFICCGKSDHVKKLVPHVREIEEIPGGEICYEKNSSRETVDNALMYRYLPRYLTDYYLERIQRLVFEWGSFKAADFRTVYKLLEEFGAVESIENIGENKLRVTYSKLQRSPLDKAFIFQSILGKGTLASPLEADSNTVRVYIERDNQLYGELDGALNYTHSFDLYNVPSDRQLSHPANHVTHPADHVTHPADHVTHPTDHVTHPADHVTHPADHMTHPSDHVTHPADHVTHPADHVTQQSNVQFVRELLSDIEYNPGFISATYNSKTEQMRVLVEHAAYVDDIVTKINSYVSNCRDMKYGNMQAVNVYQWKLSRNDKESNVSTESDSLTV